MRKMAARPERASVREARAGRFRRSARPWALALLAVISLAPGSGVAPSKGVLFPSPSLAVTGGDAARAEAWTHGFHGVYEELIQNLKLPAWPFATRYTQPGPAWPDDVYLWDTAFIADVWRLWDVSTALEIDRAVLDHADHGRLQHAVGRDQLTKDTQPPVMAWSIERNYRWGGGRDCLARAYPALKDYNRWLYDKRRLPCGLFYWVHPFESGMDNSPRFASRNVKKTADMDKIAAIDLSSYLVLQNRVLARMAETLDRPEEAREFTARADELRDLINATLWDEKAGVYFDRDMKTSQFIRIKTVASLIPLFAGVPDREQARRLRDHIMNAAEFDTPLPFPSVARDEPSFELDMWRGPVWINTSYMIILGLKQYGYGEEAADLAFRTVDRVYQSRASTGEFWEFYDPERLGPEQLHRKTPRVPIDKKKDQPKPHFVGWTGLVNNLAIEELIGLKRTGASFETVPGLPPEAEGMTFSLSLPASSMELEVTALPGGGVKGWRRIDGGQKEFAAGPGECVDLGGP